MMKRDVSRTKIKMTEIKTAHRCLVESGDLFNPVVAGPALPPGYKRTERSSSSDESEEEVAAKRTKIRPAE